MVYNYTMLICVHRLIYNNYNNNEYVFYSVIPLRNELNVANSLLLFLFLDFHCFVYIVSLSFSLNIYYTN